jgi:hypothetical protein
MTLEAFPVSAVLHKGATFYAGVDLIVWLEAIAKQIQAKFPEPGAELDGDDLIRIGEIAALEQIIAKLTETLEDHERESLP